MNKKITILVIIAILSIILVSISIFFFYGNKVDNEIAAMNLYKNLIDAYSNHNNHLLNNCDYILVDTTSIIDPLNNKQLSDNLKSEILNYCKKYTSNVYSEKPQDSSLKGVNINFHISSKDKNKYTIDINYHISNSNSIGGRNYICTYTNDMWEINDGGKVWTS